MAYITSRARPVGFAYLSLGGIAARLSAWNDARRTRNALSKLSGRELEDIGLVRGDIDQIAGDRY